MPSHSLVAAIGKKGIIFAHHYECVNRIFAAVFAYLGAQGQLETWRKFCKDFDKKKLEEVANYFSSIKFRGGDAFEGVHAYATITEGFPNSYFPSLYFTEEVLAQVRYISQLDPFPLIDPNQAISGENMRMSDQRFPATVGDEVARNEATWQRVHTFLCGPGRLLVTAAPNEAVISWLRENNVSTIVALCPFSPVSKLSLGRSAVRDGCPDYLSALAGMQHLHFPMTDNTFCLMLPKENATCFEIIWTGVNFITQVSNRLLAGQSIMVHCASGVGRAGAFNLLLQTMLDPIFSELLARVKSAEDLDPEQLMKLGERLGMLLAQIRAVRYSVQVEEQFLSVLAHAILIHLAMNETLTSENTPLFVRALMDHNVVLDTLGEVFSQASDFPRMLRLGSTASSESEVEILPVNSSHDFMQWRPNV